MIQHRHHPIRPRTLRLGLLPAAILMAQAGLAQTASGQPQNDSAANIRQSEARSQVSLEEIVVTGTLIRGVAPVGADLIGLSEQDILETGVNSADDLLRRVPQMASFNSMHTSDSSSDIPFAPPQLRGLGGLSGMSTLVLMNGHRIVPVGPAHNWIDTQMIPANHLQRVEIIPDGGSSIYGSDAVAGVINFITKKDLDRPELNVRYSMGEGSFDTLELNGSFGHTWDSGSAVVSYAFADRSALFGKDLDYIREDSSSRGGDDYRPRACSPGNVTVDGVNYPVPSLNPGPENTCSSTDYRALFPEQERHSLFGTLRQELGNTAELEVTAYWSQRDAIEYDPRDLQSTGTISADNPFFESRTGETAHDVAFSYSDVWGNKRKHTSDYELWGITPSLSLDLTDTWSLQASLNYGQSSSEYFDVGINTQAQDAALAAMDPSQALNPYNPAATNPDVLASIADWRIVRASDQELAEARVVLNGTLMDMAGGSMRAALGAETRYESYETESAIGPSAVARAPVADIDRTVNSVYGELYLPLTEALEVSISGRYDEYDDVGSTANPKIGATYTLNPNVTLRASWGTAFHAPALADLGAPVEYEVLPVSPFRDANSPFFPNFFRPTLILGGATPGMEPEEAETWSFGTDFNLTEGLSGSLTYWNITYEERIDQNAGFFFGPSYYDDPNNFSYFIRDPASPQEIIDAFGDAPVAGFPSLEAVYAIFGQPYVISDQRKQNLGSIEIDGIDFSLQWTGNVGNGSLNASLGGSYILGRDKEAVSGAGYLDTLDLGDNNLPIHPLNMNASLGYSTGPWHLSGTVYYKGEADVGPEHFDSYTTLSLFGSYEISDSMMLTLNVDNLLDEAPPWRDNERGAAYINPGPVVSLGLNTRF